MKFENVIRAAAELAYEENANQVVGKIDGVWRIAHNEDMDTQAEMCGKIFDVDSSGIVE